MEPAEPELSWLYLKLLARTDPALLESIHGPIAVGTPMPSGNTPALTEDHLQALRARHPEAVMVSALRGIGIEQLRQRLTDLAREGFIEQTIYLPVTAARTRAHVHELGEVISEDVVESTSGDGQPDSASLKLRVRASRQTHSALRSLIERAEGAK